MITTILAIWGAIVATITLIWNIKLGLSQKGRILVTADLDIVFKEKVMAEFPKIGKALLNNSDPDKQYIERLKISFYNIGKSPTTLVRYKILTNEPNTEEIKGHTVYSNITSIEIKDNDLPVVLNAGDFYTDSLSDHIVNEYFKGIEAQDSTGKSFYLPYKEIRKLKQQKNLQNLSDDENMEIWLGDVTKSKKKKWWKFWKY